MMIGAKIANFQIIQELGAGGMGTVYKARDLNLRRFVAIKVLNNHLAGDQNTSKRFRNEAEVSAQISHPNVATLHDFLEIDGKSFIIMEYVDGETLEDLLIKKGRLSRKKSVDFTIQILKGLSAAHAKGILHRDLKPANIMITKDGYVRIMDFGIALMENATRLTTHNKVIGTINYMAPELLTGSLPTEGSDLYAVGLMLYEMIAGTPLLHADSEAALMYKIVHEKVPVKLPGENDDLEHILNKSIHKTSTKRYTSTKDFLHALSQEEGRRTFIAKSILSKFGNLETRLKKLTPSFLIKNEKTAYIFSQINESVNSRFLIFCVATSVLAILIISFLPKVGDSQSYRSEPLAEDTNISLPMYPTQTNYRDYESEYQISPSLYEETKPSVKDITSDPPSDQETKSPPPLSHAPETPEDPKAQEKQLKEEPSTEITVLEDSSKVQEEVVEKFNAIEEDETPTKNEELHLPTKSVTLIIRQKSLPIEFPIDVSSKDYEEGSVIILMSGESLIIDGYTVIEKGASVRAKVVRNKKSASGKVKFGLRLQDVQASNGQWLELKYPEYTDIQSDEVLFEKGRKINKVLLAFKKLEI